MAYVDQSRRPSPASMIAVIGVHAAIGTALIAGLTVSGAIPEVITKIEGTNIPKTPPPPPPPPPADPQPKTADPVRTEIFTPLPKLELKPVEPTIPTTTLIPPAIPAIPQPGSDKEGVVSKPASGFDPVAARPKNDPSRWLTDRDYRSSWARRELTGLAKFRLEIAANGTVTDCTVTGSTGHAELDAATCALVTKRARFEPARGSKGEPVAGSYSSAVRWTLPE